MRKVLIVDDSKTIREILHRVLSEDPELRVVGSAANPIEARPLLAAEQPDVITLDIHMPRMNGVEWLEELLPRQAIPVVMISSLQLQEGNAVFRALELGAVDYIQKPALRDLAQASSLIREKVKAASFAKVIRHAVAPRPTSPVNDTDPRKVLAIGASTGGTEAIRSVLCALPAHIPPTLIVQHIPPVFSKAFADRLNGLCPFEVKEAEDGDELKPSRVLIAPGGKQMAVARNAKGLYVKVNDDPPVSRHKPSVDYLFRSVAKELGSQAVGVILTGMGSDGAEGLRQMRDRGARTIGQDEESCVVYGMPKAARAAGALAEVVALSQVPRAILAAIARPRSASATRHRT